MAKKLMGGEIPLSPGHSVHLTERAPGLVTHQVQFLQLRRRRAEVNFSVPEHLHQDVEILVPQAGVYHCRIQGEPCTVAPGQAVVVMPGELHVDCTPHAVTVWALQFAMTPAEPWGTMARVISAGELQSIIDQMLAIPLDIMTAAVQDAWCMQALAIILRHRAGSMAPPFAMLLRAKMEALLDRPLDLEALSRDVGMSRRLLSQRCREACGTSPARFMQDLRLHRSRTLVTGTDLPVRVIARRCGFANPNHFATAYRRRYGHAPRRGKTP